MSIEKMKSILVQKFKGENCSFTKNDIIIKKATDTHYQIHIKDYEHIVFNMFLYEDAFFNEKGEMYIVHITSEDMKQFDESIYIETLTNFDIESALIELGYYIASRF